VHSTGCRRWFNAVRDTATYEVLAVYRPTDPRPALAAAGTPQETLR
jgi:sarcosine oxidase subunit delta